MNIQFAIKKEDGRQNVYVLEVNPRASRTVPFVSKATGMPVAKIAAKVMAGVSLAELGCDTRADSQPRVGQGKRVPVPQVPRRRHRAGARDALDRRGDGHQRAVFDRLCQKPIGRRHGAADAKGRSSSAWRRRPRSTWSSLAERLSAMGYQADGHRGNRPPVGRGRHRRCSTSTSCKRGIPTCSTICSTAAIQLIMNTPSGKGARTDEGRIRSAAVAARRALHHHHSGRRRRGAGDGSAAARRNHRASAARPLRDDRVG